MTMQINVLAGLGVQGGPGIGLMTSAGNPWTVSDSLAVELVQNRKVATYVTAPADQVLFDVQKNAAALQALVSGAGTFPISEAASRGASSGYVEVLGTYIETRSNVPTSADDMLAQMPAATAINTSHVYIDPVNGNDANTGYAPDTAKRNISNAGWTNGITSYNPGMQVLIARGSDIAVNVPLGQGNANMSGSMSLGAFGDPSKPRPILRFGAGAVNNSAGLCWIDPDGAFLADMELDFSALDSSSVQRHGVRMICSSNVAPFRNVVISNVKVRAPRTAAGPNWTGGITLNKTTTNNSAAPVVRSAGLVRIDGVEVYGAGCHGIQILGAMGYQLPNGSWGGVEIINSYVHDCGLDYDSHAITSVCDSGYSAQIGANATLVGGTTYYLTMSTLYARSVGDIELMKIEHNSRDSCLYYLTKNTATPTTPAVGEFGFDNATQRLYVNTGAALAANDVLKTVVAPPRGILYGRNRAESQLFLNNSPFQEGAGFQFDDWTSDSLMYCNRSVNNGGAGFAINHGVRNRVIRNLSDGNARVGVGFLGAGTLIAGNVIVGGSSRPAGARGLIASDPGNGYMGGPANQIRRNFMLATSALDAYIVQTDKAGYRGTYTHAALNEALAASGVAVPAQALGKVLGF